MDESVGDAVNEMSVVDGTHFRSNDSEYSSKFCEHGIQESHDVVALTDSNQHGNSSQYFIDILDGKNMGRIGSSVYASSSPRCIDDNEIMVRELTLKNYNTGNLPIIGIPGNRERVQSRPSQWRTLYQIADRSGKGSSHRNAADEDKSSTLLNVLEGEDDKLFTDFLEQNQKSTLESHNLVTGISQSNNDDKPVLHDLLRSSGSIRTKIISKSGFSEYFIKSTLKGKGTIHRGPTARALGKEYVDQSRSDCANVSLVDSRSADNALSPPTTYHDGVNLREWLKMRRNKLCKAESLSIFKQFVDLVHSSHSQGIILLDLRPSCFKLLQSNHVLYLGTSALTEPTENNLDRDVPEPEKDHLKRPLENIMHNSVIHNAKKLKLGDPMSVTKKWPQLPPRSRARPAQNTDADFAWPRGSDNDKNEVHKLNSQRKFSSPDLSRSPQPLLTSVSCMFEAKWYTSPEQINKGSCTLSSNIYCLGVLFFELLCLFDSGRSHAAAMQDLCHRILPSSFLSENPKEAGFCLWLLHPEPSSRPTIREILQSEILGGKRESRDEVLSSIIEEDSESELLMHFLSLLEEQKQNDVSKLGEEIKCIEADIQEVQRRQTKQSSVSSSSIHESLGASGSRYIYMDEMKLKNIRQLESAYFSMRSNIQPSSNDVKMCRNGQIFKNHENNNMKRIKEEKYENSDCLGGFFDGLCKYARYSKFRVRGVMRNGDFNSSANVICSLSFDRDEEYLAAGGVSKKIKIYEYHTLFNDSVDIHYPLLEMSNNSKLSCICWNSYIRNYLATTDYDGVVKLWDATSGQGFFHFNEHSERAWSVDFSRKDPTKLASGSDDRLVKLWSINEKNSICTIRNNANVCSVQFSPYSSNLLAYSSADYRIYCYDLRNVTTPLSVLVGHEKAVSYVKFLDAETLVSASTDNTLKIWDLNKTSSNAISTDACGLTLRGHTNEKNFVGLSVADGYISCGSETNEVFAYYKSQPMPITSYKFGSIDPISGKETEDDNGQFVSSVCWRRKSNMVVAANSTGCIKLLEMV